MTAQLATKESTKTLLLESGIEIMLEKGYNNTGIMDFSGGSAIVGNVVTGNLVVGAFVTGATDVVGNAFYGNFATALRLVNSFSGSVAKNNFVGNDPFLNCALQLTVVPSATATNNYWGAPTGPGADPADTTCNGTVTTTPFATRPFNVKASIKP